MPISIYYQYGGETGVFETVSIMRDLVNWSYNHPWIVERARKIVSGCWEPIFPCHHKVLTGFIRRVMSYRKDPPGLEALQDPVEWIERRLRAGEPLFGDCDDMAIYLASLLKSLGHNPFFRVVGKKDVFHHVHVICEGEFLDPSVEEGKEPKSPGRAIQIAI